MIYRLNSRESSLLRKGLQAAMATFFIDGIEDFIWEAIFAYVKGVKLVDPLNETRAKLLFDVVDTKKRIGWSAKTGLTTSFEGGHEVELVIQRADIFGENIKLSKKSVPNSIGKAVMEHWYAKVYQDATTQGVEDKRVCILLKSKENDTFAYIEESLVEYSPDEIVWIWTNKERKGLQGRRKADGKLKFRWYPSGSQLFERFVIPDDVDVIKVAPRRLPVKIVMDFLIASLDSLEFSGKK